MSDGMEDAQVGGGERHQQVQPTQMVNVDDLVWSIGQNTVEQMGYKKLVEQLNGQLRQLSQNVQDATAHAQDAEARAQKAEHQAQEYKQSVDFFDTKNKELAETLKKEREQYNELLEERDALQEEINRRDKISGKKKKLK